MPAGFRTSSPRISRSPERHAGWPDRPAPRHRRCRRSDTSGTAGPRSGERVLARWGRVADRGAPGLEGAKFPRPACGGWRLPPSASSARCWMVREAPYQRESLRSRMAPRMSAQIIGPGRYARVRIGALPWPLLAAMNNSRSSRGRARTDATLGSISARRSFERTVFADPPCSPAMAKTG